MEIIEFSVHLLDLTRNSCEKYNYRSLAGIEPAALQLLFNRVRCQQNLDIYLGTTYAGADRCRFPLPICSHEYIIDCVLFVSSSFMFDEPSSYLDVKQRLKAALAIRSLARNNRWVCYSDGILLVHRLLKSGSRSILIFLLVVKFFLL
jgi:hypothetical protein